MLENISDIFDSIFTRRCIFQLQYNGFMLKISKDIARAYLDFLLKTIIL